MADLKRHEELVVITKTYDLILWSCNHTGKFPRNHRFVPGERIERHLYDPSEGLIRAEYTRQRHESLERPARPWKSCASRSGSPKTCSVSRSRATASQTRPLTR